MNILIVSGTFPPRKFGGVTASSFKLATSLKQRGHNVTVYTTDTGNDERHRLSVPFHENTNGFDVYYFKNFSNRLAFKYRMYMPLRLISMMHKANKNPFSVVAVQDFRSLLSVIVYFMCKKYNTPYVIQAHGSLTYEEGNTTLKKVYDFFFGRRILSGASKVIALTRFEADQYKALGVQADRIEVIPNWINIEGYTPPPPKGLFLEKCGILPNERVLLSLGRLNKIKGIDLLIHACSEVFEEMENVKLIIAGPDDGDLMRLQSMVKELYLESKVHFVGPLHGEEKIAAYCDADLFVMPSVYEAFGNTILESLACGTPVIVTKGCHIADTIKEVGIVVDCDCHSLSRAIVLLLKDESLLQKYGIAGQNLVFRDFCEEEVINKVESLYGSCTIVE